MSIFDTLDESLLDRDLALVDGDLVLTDSGDVGILEGEENIDEAVRRRLALRKGDAASLVLDIEGLWVLNQELGNRGYSRLSEPGNGLQLSNLRQDALDCLADEERLTILDVGTKLEMTANGLTSTVSIDHVLSNGRQATVSVAANAITGFLEVT